MSVNKVILIGNVGKDPDVRYLENNVRVANFPLATTDRGYTMSNGTQVPDHTEWHSIVVWRNLAELAEKHIRKGARLYIEGRIKSRSYEDKSGIRRYITEIYAEDVQILSRPQQQSDVQQNVQQATTQTQPTANTETSKVSENGENDNGNEGLPF